MDKLKFIALIRQNTSELINMISNTNLGWDNAEYKVFAINFANRFANLNNQTAKEKSKFGSWYCQCDKRGIQYIVLADDNYDEKNVYRILYLLKSNFKILGKNYEDFDNNILRLHSKAKMDEIMNQENGHHKTLYTISQKVRQIYEQIVIDKNNDNNNINITEGKQNTQVGQVFEKQGQSEKKKPKNLYNLQVFDCLGKSECHNLSQRLSGVKFKISQTVKDEEHNIPGVNPSPNIKPNDNPNEFRFTEPIKRGEPEKRTIKKIEPADLNLINKYMRESQEKFERLAQKQDNSPEHQEKFERIAKNQINIPESDLQAEVSNSTKSATQQASYQNSIKSAQSLQDSQKKQTQQSFKNSSDFLTDIRQQNARNVHVLEINTARERLQTEPIDRLNTEPADRLVTEPIDQNVVQQSQYYSEEMYTEPSQKLYTEPSTRVQSPVQKNNKCRGCAFQHDEKQVGFLQGYCCPLCYALTNQNKHSWDCEKRALKSKSPSPQQQQYQQQKQLPEKDQRKRLTSNPNEINHFLKNINRSPKRNNTNENLPTEQIQQIAREHSYPQVYLPERESYQQNNYHQNNYQQNNYQQNNYPSERQSYQQQNNYQLNNYPSERQSYQQNNYPPERQSYQQNNYPPERQSYQQQNNSERQSYQFQNNQPERQSYQQQNQYQNPYQPYQPQKPNQTQIKEQQNTQPNNNNNKYPLNQPYQPYKPIQTPQQEQKQPNTNNNQTFNQPPYQPYKPIQTPQKEQQNTQLNNNIMYK